MSLSQTIKNYYQGLKYVFDLFFLFVFMSIHIRIVLEKYIEITIWFFENNFDNLFVWNHPQKLIFSSH